jgi:RNA 2',3'-cyclic 3'-phosphodiesterase
MSALRRAFLAIVPPPEVLDAVDLLLERSKSSRFVWTKREQWHVTMQFVGRVNDSDALVTALAPAVGAFRRIPLRLRGGGAFSAPKKARVFWLGVENEDSLFDLHAEMMAAAGTFVSGRDRVAFRAHLTLARLKRVTDLTPDVDALSGVAVGPQWTATEVLLFESETRRTGAVYSEIARLPLAVATP